MATVLVGLALVGVSWMMTASATSQALLQRDSADSLLMAREMLELARSLDRAPSGSGPATAADEVLALDSLDGASFSPPLRADLTAFDDLDDWTQQVDVDVVTVDDLETVVSETLPDSLPKGSDELLRLTVTILDGSGAEVDTHRWWIAP